MWDSTPAKIHGELNAFYPFYTLVLLLIKMIRKNNIVCFMSTILWKSFETTIAVLPRAPLRLLCLPWQSPKRSCLHKVSSSSQIFSDVQRLLFSDVQMFRCIGALIFWCLGVQRLRCWECDHFFHVQIFISSYMFRGWMFKCSDVPRFSCSKASRKCSKYQLSLQMSSIWELYLMTQNARRNILQVF